MEDVLSVGVLRASEGHVRPYLVDKMFRSRGAQFREELGWDLYVDSLGRERDEYDEFDPTYLIVKNEKGTHVGSTRLLPTTGRTMIYEKFPGLNRENFIIGEDVWEVTRFFVGRRAQPEAAPLLMLSGLLLAETLGISHYVGVVSSASTRVYSLIGWPPKVLETVEHNREEISFCMWSISPAVKSRLQKRARLDLARLSDVTREVEIAALASLSSSLASSVGDPETPNTFQFCA